MLAPHIVVVMNGNLFNILSAIQYDEHHDV
jgi:hypothetical protein